MNTQIFHHILIPVDFSPTCESAIEEGAFIAKSFGADIVLLHAIEGMHSYPQNWFTGCEPSTINGIIRKKVSAKLNTYAKKIRLKYEISVENLTHVGKPTEVISETVAERDIDLIVMGTHGARGFEEFFLGSNANKIVNLAPCPVITIRQGFHENGIKSIVLPIDDSLHSRQKVNDVIPIAEKCNAVVHLLGLIQSNNPVELAKLNIKLDTVEELANKAGLKCVRKVVNGHNIAMEAMKYAEEVKAQMLAIMTDHESNMTGMFMGVFAQQIVNHSKVPVLSIRPIKGNYAYPT